MLEVSGPPRAPDIREALRTSQSITEANSYRTREVVDITVNGSVGKWHSLKGGVTPHRKESSTESGNVSYEIFFNPTTNSWLKIAKFFYIAVTVSELLNKCDIILLQLKQKGR